MECPSWKDQSPGGDPTLMKCPSCAQHWDWGFAHLIAGGRGRVTIPVLQVTTVRTHETRVVRPKDVRQSQHLNRSLPVLKSRPFDALCLPCPSSKVDEKLDTVRQRRQMAKSLFVDGDGERARRKAKWPRASARAFSFPCLRIQSQVSAFLPLVYWLERGPEATPSFFL